MGIIELKDALESLTADIIIGNMMITADGGIARKIINKTGVASVKGTIVCLSTADDNAFIVCPAGGEVPMGIVYEAGVADASECWVVTEGKAKVLLADTTASTSGYWARLSATVNGRADITNATPPGGAIAELQNHMTEIGHCVEDKTAGTGVLASIYIHWN